MFVTPSNRRDQIRTSAKEETATDPETSFEPEFSQDEVAGEYGDQGVDAGQAETIGQVERNGRVVDTEFGHHAALVDAALLKNLSRPARDKLATRLTEAWIGNLSRAEGPDDELLDQAIDQLGFHGFVKLLSTKEGTPHLLAAALAASLFLDQETDEITKTTKAKKKMLARAANEPYQDILNGNLNQAVVSLSGSLANLAESLEMTMVYSAKNPRLLNRARALHTKLIPVRERLEAARRD